MSVQQYMDLMMSDNVTSSGKKQGKRKSISRREAGRLSCLTSCLLSSGTIGAEGSLNHTNTQVQHSTVFTNVLLGHQARILLSPAWTSHQRCSPHPYLPGSGAECEVELVEGWKLKYFILFYSFIRKWSSIQMGYGLGCSVRVVSASRASTPHHAVQQCSVVSWRCSEVVTVTKSKRRYHGPPP